MKRKYLLAAEMFNYSYDNYIDHVEAENIRFTKLMPEEALLVERAELEGWSDEKLASLADYEVDKIPRLREDYRRAIRIIEQKNPAEIFRQGVIESIKVALEKGIQSDEDVEDLAVQVCYRAADLSVLLTDEGKELRHYSKELRWTTGRELPGLD
jgi:uncharacterized protein